MALPARYRDDFLDLLMETGNVSRSAAALGVNRLTVYRWRGDDPGFAQAWDLALEAARQGLRERVVETATALGLGRWAPVLDPATGAPELDDDFEPVTRFETAHVDARVLMKWMDKALSDSPTRVEASVRGALSIRLRERLDLEGVPTEQLEALGALLALPAGVVDAEAVEVVDA